MTSEPIQPTRRAAVVACPKCGSSNAPANNFCTECGSRLAGAAEGPPVPDAATPTRPGMKPHADAPDRALACIVHLLPDETTQSHVIAEELVIGRNRGQLRLPGDTFLSREHAAIRRNGGEYLLRDLASSNGTYVRLREEVELRSGDQFMVGSQLLRFVASPSVGPAAGGRDGFPDGPDRREPGATMLLGVEAPIGPRLVRIAEGGYEAEIFPLNGARMVIGRDEGDLTFPDDSLLSAVHATIAARDGSMNNPPAERRFVLRDEGSRNGVFFRIRGERLLRSGDIFAAGRQVFRFEAPEAFPGVSSPGAAPARAPDSFGYRTRP